MSVYTRQLRYALCPKCGDAIEARINAGPLLKCSYCLHEFDSSEVKVKLGLLSYDYETNRWAEALPVNEPLATRRTQRR
jgi:DNA-directed RNA polymerase subunit M/transcription elongation factor TFIIS